MAQPLRIALPIDLAWPVKRHHEVFSGIQDYTNSEAPHWAIIPDLFPAQWIKPTRKGPGYDAVIGRLSQTVARAATKAGVPMVNLWLNSPVKLEVPSVLVDFAEAGRMAAAHLVSRGLRRLAGIGYRRDTATQRYFEGLRTAAQAHRIPISLHYVNFSHSDNEENWHRYINDINRWIDGWEVPLGIAAVYDNQARYITMMCQRRGFQIPEQIAVIGTNDDLPVCEGSDPTLSSIDMGMYRAGYVAAELLDQLLKGGEAPTEPILVPPADLVARQSTDVYTVADKTVGRAMRFIAEHCREPIRVMDVVNHVGCDRRGLEKQFRAARGKSINEEIVALRIELTKRLLISTDDSTEEVAAAAGYGTAQHMRHVFRHQLNTTPTAYREKHRK